MVHLQVHHMAGKEAADSWRRESLQRKLELTEAQLQDSLAATKAASLQAAGMYRSGNTLLLFWQQVSAKV